MSEQAQVSRRGDLFMSPTRAGTSRGSQQKGTHTLGAKTIGMSEQAQVSRRGDLFTNSTRAGTSRES